jgi:hypothetical protein
MCRPIIRLTEPIAAFMLESYLVTPDDGLNVVGVAPACPA